MNRNDILDYAIQKFYSNKENDQDEYITLQDCLLGQEETFYQQQYFKINKIKKDEDYYYFDISKGVPESEKG